MKTSLWKKFQTFEHGKVSNADAEIVLVHTHTLRTGLHLDFLEKRSSDAISSRSWDLKKNHGKQSLLATCVVGILPVFCNLDLHLGFFWFWFCHQHKSSFQKYLEIVLSRGIIARLCAGKTMSTIIGNTGGGGSFNFC